MICYKNKNAIIYPWNLKSRSSLSTDTSSTYIITFNIIMVSTPLLTSQNSTFQIVGTFTKRIRLSSISSISEYKANIASKVIRR